MYMEIEKAVANELELLSRISGDRAKSFVYDLSKAKMRIPGSESERRAADMIAEEFRKLDLDVSIEEFKAKSWEHYPSKLVLSNGPKKDFEVQLMPYSPPISEGGAKGVLTCLRFGFPREYEQLVDDSCILLIDWNEDLGSLAQMLTAARSGKKISALGLISALSKAYRVDAVPMISKPISFPIFSLTKEDGQLLRSLCGGKKVTARLEGKSKIIPDATSANVVGRKKGTTEPDLKILVTAHHDGWFEGANDNLASVACVLEVARAVCDLNIRRSMEFISFGSEEGGADGYQYYLWGSRQYLKKHGNDLWKLACQFNAEFAGNCNSNYLLVDCTPDLVSFFEVLFDALAEKSSLARGDVQLGVTIPPNSQADQLPFARNGVPSSLLYWSWYDEYHSDLDTVETLKSDKLHLFSELMLLSSLRAAQQEILPLSLTRYARTLRVGHTDFGPPLSNDLRKVVILGLDQLKKISSELLDFTSVITALDSFAKAAAYFERDLSSPEHVKLFAKNKRLVKTCGILNKSLCRIGGVFGEEPLFPGFVPYLEELKKIDAVIEVIKKVSGADISSELKLEFYPMFKPEVDVAEFDLNKEFESLSAKRERFRESLQVEIERVAAALREAENCL